MVKQLKYWLIHAYVLIMALVVYYYNEAVQKHPLTLLFFLLLVGAPQVYYLAHYSIPYFHWFFYVKTSVVKETRSLLLVYMIFLIIGILTNAILQSPAFIITVALILPIAAGFIAFAHELWEYEKRHGWVFKRR